ncbi:hypothetical protein CHS0354_037658 [Potamilus streckersoni]|uniref:TROVE domain-containing protein n=1 Tax=Potamilus streckersoni TaxID=2493646 RepID=A0AAE0T7K0_9BIVA|nr:hypothetical protein CHS0354_037658 [Potamilus streckersoni]
MARPLVLTDDASYTRYLKTGAPGNFYLPGKNKTFRYTDNVLVRLIAQEKGDFALDELVRVSKEKTYVKREPLLFMLAVAVNSNNRNVKCAAHLKLSEVCEDTKDLFTFLKHNKNYDRNRKGWGRGLRRAVNNWYNTKDAIRLAELVTRYRFFAGWGHRDVFRMAHIAPANEALALVVKYIVKGLDEAKEGQENASDEIKRIISYLDAVHTVKHSTDDTAVAGLIEKYGLRIEHVPCPLYSSKDVWVSLLENMSLTDILKYLPVLGSRGFLTVASKEGSTDEACKLIQSKVLDKVMDASAIETERIGPFAMYIAIKNYMRTFADKSEMRGEHRGKGSAKRKEHPFPDIRAEPQSKKKKKKKKDDGKENKNDSDNKSETSVPPTYLTDKVENANPELFKALHNSFRVAVEKTVPSTGKRFLVAVKSSVNSFGQAIRGCPTLTALEIMAVMTAVIGKNEKHREFGFFTASFNLLKYHEDLKDLIQEIGNKAAPIPNLKCDPAAPITWALEKNRPYDVFLIMTDGQESKGEVSPAARLVEYREKMQLPDTKLIICGLLSPKMYFADEVGMMDIGGFDATVPEVIYKFIDGEI